MIYEMTEMSAIFMRDLAKFLVCQQVLPFVGLFLVVAAFGIFRAVIDR